MKGPRKGSRTLALIGAGFAVWSAAFILLYGLQAIGCRIGWNTMEFMYGISIQRFVQVALYVSSLIASIVLYCWLRVRAQDTRAHAAVVFVNEASVNGALAALGAIAFCFAGVAWLTAC